MEYAIKVLEDDARLIKECLRSSDWKGHPESEKRQKDKLKQLEKAIEKLKQQNI